MPERRVVAALADEEAVEEAPKTQEAGALRRLPAVLKSSSD
jgi:hypothetical protein